MEASQNVSHWCFYFWKRTPEIAMLFILTWHRLRIKALLVSGSVSSDRCSFSAPCFYAPKVRSDPSLRLGSAVKPNHHRRFLFHSLGLKILPWNLRSCLDLWLTAKFGICFVFFTHLKLAHVRLSSAPRLQNSWVCLWRTGEGWVDKGLLNGGG